MICEAKTGRAKRLPASQRRPQTLVVCTCAICGRSFLAGNDGAKYCSGHCRYVAERARIQKLVDQGVKKPVMAITAVCVTCGTSYKTRDPQKSPHCKRCRGILAAKARGYLPRTTDSGILAEPTDIPPGDARVDVYAARIAKGLCLWHPQDAGFVPTYPRSHGG